MKDGIDAHSVVIVNSSSMVDALSATPFAGDEKCTNTFNRNK